MKKYSYTDFGDIALPLDGVELKESKKRTERSKDVMDIERFKEMKEKKETWVVNFSLVKPNGDFELIVNGIRVIMPNEDLGDWVKKGLDKNAKRGPRYDAEKRDTWLLYQYPVKVVSVDEEKKEVIVSWQSAKMSDRDRVEKNIRTITDAMQPEKREIENAVQNEVLRMCHEELAAQMEMMAPKTQKNFQKRLVHEKMIDEFDKRKTKMAIVKARVVEVDRVGCKINLLNYDIPGYIPKYFWSFGFIDDMREVVEVNDVIGVAVLAYKKNKEGQSIPISGKGKGMYLCARTPLIDNPWKREPFPFSEGDIVRLTCTKVKQHNYFGIVNGYDDLDDFEIYCEYPNEERNIRIIEGEEYECRIFRINKDTKLIRAKTIRKVKPAMTRT